MKVCERTRLSYPAEHVEAAGPLGGLHADRDREGARLDHGVGDGVHVDEPVLALEAENAGVAASRQVRRRAPFSSSSRAGCRCGRSPFNVFWS